MKKQIFKEGDRVFDPEYGWGKVTKTGETFPVQVDYDSIPSVMVYMSDGRLSHESKTKVLSFTEYDLESGGFSQKRPVRGKSEYDKELSKFLDYWQSWHGPDGLYSTPDKEAAKKAWMKNAGYDYDPEPKLEVGKSYKSKGGFVVINRSGDIGNYGFDPEGEFRQNLFCSTHDCWQEIPETEAIEILAKECVKWGGEDWRNVNIKECLYHGKTNIVGTVADIGIDEIWNNNGCIFKDGVWAEKLEEPKIKEGQMIWVRSSFSDNWNLREFADFDCSGLVRTKMKANNSCLAGWRYYSITNPYPESIEARAIDLLRESVKFQMACSFDIYRKKRDEFLKEVDSYEKT